MLALAALSSSPALAATASTTPAADAPLTDSVLLFPLKSVGASDEERTAVSEALSLQITAWLSLKVVTLDEVRELVQKQVNLQTLACDDASCAVELTRAANTQFALSGSLGRVGGDLVLSLTLIDARNPLATAGANRTASAIAPLIDTIPALLAGVFGRQLHADSTFKLVTGKPYKLAVLDLKASGVPETTVQNLTQVLAVAIKRIEGMSVVSRDDMASMLQFEEQRQQFASCESDAFCLAELGGALGVDKLVVGQVGRLGQAYLISLRLIDARRAEVDHRVSESFIGDEEQLIRAVRAAGRSLLGVELQGVGSLAVQSAEAQAELFVDATSKGKLPMPPLTDLPPGRHALRVSKDGFVDWRSDVYADPGETTAVWVVLTEAPRKWYQKWWVWTAAATVVAGGTAAVLYALRDRQGTLDVVAQPPGGGP